MLRTRAIICSLFLAVTAGAATLAQSNNPVTRAPEPPELVLVTMKFPGGTVADYVQAIKKAAGDINIITAIEAKEVPMPPVELTNASLSGALYVLDGKTAQVSDRYIKLELHENGGGSINEQMVYSIDAKVQGRPVDERIMQRVWSVKSILDDGTKANDVLTAIQTSLDLLNDAAKPAQLKFHESTGLIIARASPDQIDAIQQVIEQLGSRRSPRVAQAEEKVSTLNKRLADCESEQARLQSLINEMKQKSGK